MTVRVMQPKCMLDRNKIYRFLYEIWSEEFSRSMEGMDHANRLIKDDLDDTATHFIAVDPSGCILGCVRFNFLGTSTLPERLQRCLKPLELVAQFGHNRVGYCSHFAVAPIARGRTVSSLLISALYRFCLNEDVLAAISYCALPLVSFYYQLGYRPYMENFRIDVGVRVPIVNCLQDLAYLETIKSPLSRLCPRELDDGGATAKKLTNHFPAFRMPVFSQTNVRHLWARLTFADPNDTAERKDAWFDTLSEEEWQIISRWASEVSFAKGEYVCRRGDNDRLMGVLVSGSLGVNVMANGAVRIINIILAGEPFGEISSLGGGRQTTDIIALEQSTACILPHDFLEKVCCENTGLGLRLAKNLLKLIATRFAHLANASAGDAGAVSASVRVGRPLSYQLSVADEIESRIESYRFDRLGDQGEEFKRLITQASVGEDMEFDVLNRIGLVDGATFLDLGSGPGVTSLLVARRLPGTTIIGVEPEDLLRTKSKALIESQGFSDRCRFLKGTGSRIPLAGNTSDFSYARFLFQHLPNPLEVLGEMQRVTRSGGLVVVLDVDDRTNIVYPEPPGIQIMEERIAAVQVAAGGDRHVGRKLNSYMHKIGLQDTGVEFIPISAPILGRETFFSIVYSFKRQILERAGLYDETAAAFFSELDDLIRKPTTFAMTTVFAAYGVVP
ncbi:MAG: GNAT family N-acetyltransferase [Desulfatitalea sp.]|nr:GNAT family N-acetyltransferase [Desulfatitalea sp.]NNK00448.1 GNAT family N-acetyltransferase [Desulfatitalea sp.]